MNTDLEDVQKTSKCLSEMSFQQPLQKEAFEIEVSKKAGKSSY